MDGLSCPYKEVRQGALEPTEYTVVARDDDGSFNVFVIFHFLTMVL